ncbi:MAG: hypothetical protein JXA77_17750 [Bacteroidales bacterium]|nr:hypothetical protein [Bacteroidales bacterium]MBN2819125.1 hypothetical protein [Bacteroidales bacterium]
MLQISSIKKYLALIFLIFLSGTLFARKVPGYIVTATSDTIFGIVKLCQYNPYTTGFVVGGVNLESYYTMVKFREINQKKYTLYVPEDIMAFGFSFKKVDYHFKSMGLEFYNRFRSEQIEPRFLCLIYKNDIELYKNMVRTHGFVSNKNYNKNSIVYYDYYLYSEDVGLTQINTNKDHKNIRELLARYGVEQEFLETLPPKTNYKNIKSILVDYFDWKENPEN